MRDGVGFRIRGRQEDRKRHWKVADDERDRVSIERSVALSGLLAHSHIL